MLISEIIKQKNELSSTLADACPSVERYEQLIDELEAKMIHNRDTLLLNHNRTINRLLDAQFSPTEWIPRLHLTSIERNFITSNEYLCDRIIDAAMMLLQEAHPNLSIQSVLLPSSLLTYSVNPNIHIHHIGGNHFVTSSTIGNPAVVTIYDSVNTPILSKQLEEQITSIYSPDTAPPTIRQTRISHSQKGGVYCGLFSIAYAIELAAGHDPVSYHFDQGQMHLINCLE